MKLYHKGFTLIEIMIVLLVIGMLSVALFPQVSGYIARGRDTERLAGLKQISIAVTAFQVNKQILPNGTGATNSCVNITLLKSVYASIVPIDPIITRMHGACSIPGVFGYGTGRLLTINKAVLSASFENPQGGNTGSINSYQVDNIPAIVVQQINSLKKGYGSGYVMHN